MQLVISSIHFKILLKNTFESEFIVFIILLNNNITISKENRLICKLHLVIIIIKLNCTRNKTQLKKCIMYIILCFNNIVLVL